MVKHYLRVGEFLATEGEWLQSPNGLWKAAMMSDGTLVVFALDLRSALGLMGGDPHPAVICWSSNERYPISNFYAIMQADGNLVIYNGTGPSNQRDRVWDSNTSQATDNFYLVLQDDGRLAIYKGTGPSDQRDLVWHSAIQVLYELNVGSRYDCVKPQALNDIANALNGGKEVEAEALVRLLAKNNAAVQRIVSYIAEHGDKAWFEDTRNGAYVRQCRINDAAVCISARGLSEDEASRVRPPGVLDAIKYSQVTVVYEASGKTSYQNLFIAHWQNALSQTVLVDLMVKWIADALRAGVQELARDAFRIEPRFGHQFLRWAVNDAHAAQVSRAEAAAVILSGMSHVKEEKQYRHDVSIYNATDLAFRVDVRHRENISETDSEFTGGKLLGPRLARGSQVVAGFEAISESDRVSVAHLSFKSNDIGFGINSGVGEFIQLTPDGRSDFFTVNITSRITVGGLVSSINRGSSAVWFDGKQLELPSECLRAYNDHIGEQKGAETLRVVGARGTIKVIHVRDRVGDKHEYEYRSILLLIDTKSFS